MTHYLIDPYKYAAPPEFKVGSFTKSDSVTTQAITGVGFTPKAIIFWTSGSNAASGTFDPHVSFSLGVTTGASESYALGASAEDNVNPFNASTRMSAKAIILQSPSAPSGPQAVAVLQSFDSDGFTLNWTSNTATAPFGGVVVNYLAIGGNYVNAKAMSWIQSGGTGNQSVTGVGFQPDMVLNFGYPGANMDGNFTGAEYVAGAFDGASQFGVDNRMTDGGSTAERIQSTTYIGPRSFKLSAVSLDADGFTMNKIDHVNNPHHLALCLGGAGLRVKVGTITVPTGTGNSAVTGVGFQPGALMLFGINHTSMDSNTTNAAMAVAATDGTNHRNAAHFQLHTTVPSQADAKWDSDHAISVPASGPGVDHEASFVSFDSDGFTLNWTDAAASGTDVFYIAFGGP